eukprot:gene7076-14390_t
MSIKATLILMIYLLFQKCALLHCEVDNNFSGRSTLRMNELMEEASRLAAKSESYCRVEINSLLCSGDVQYSFETPSNKLLIFISSTFEDTKHEQDALLTRAFPFLRGFCNVLGLEFDVVSMRWGVRSRSGNDHKTSELCMSQLDKCLKMSCGIAYATIQSHRYGYRPFPSVIRKDIFEEIVRHLRLLEINSQDLLLLDIPYWLLDESSDPPVYKLQPVSSLPGLADYLLSDEDKLKAKLDDDFKQERQRKYKTCDSKWWEIFTTMQRLLRLGAESSSSATTNALSEDDCKSFNISVTHHEVNFGLFNNPKCNDQCIYFERNISGIDEEGLASMDIDTCNTAAAYKEAQWAPWDTVPRFKDQEAETLVEQLKTSIINHPHMNPSRIHRYTVPWVHGTLLDKRQSKEPPQWESYISSLCNTFINDVCSQLLTTYKKPFNDPLLAEILHHRNLVRSKLACAGFARSGTLGAIKNYVTGESTGKVFVLHGKSGAGKSWLMSQAISAAREYLTPDSIVIYRLLGTSKDSSDVLSLIRSISHQTGRGGEVPVDSKEALTWFAQGNFLPPQKNNEKVVLFLDSIDQLSVLFKALDKVSGWIPGLEFNLPVHCRVVISTLPTELGRDLVGQLRHVQGAVQFEEVSALSSDCIHEAITEMFNCIPPKGTLIPTKRILTDTNKDLLVRLFEENPSPLFLTVAMDIVSKWPSYLTPEQTAVPLLEAAKSGVRGLINMIFSQLDDTHGKLLVDKVLGAITASREGMSRSELEDLVSCDDVVLDDIFEWWTPPIRRIPPMLVERILSDLGDFVVERGASGGISVYHWYHRQFWEAAENRYLSTQEIRKDVHGAIARYFAGELHDMHSSMKDRLIYAQPWIGAGGIANKRKLWMLPVNALLGCDWRLAQKALCSINTLECASAGSMLEELKDMYREAITTCETQQRAGNTNSDLSTLVHNLRAFEAYVKTSVLALQDHTLVLQRALFTPAESLVRAAALETVRDMVKSSCRDEMDAIITDTISVCSNEIESEGNSSNIVTKTKMMEDNRENLDNKLGIASSITANSSSNTMLRSLVIVQNLPLKSNIISKISTPIGCDLCDTFFNCNSSNHNIYSAVFMNSNKRVIVYDLFRATIAFDYILSFGVTVLKWAPNGKKLASVGLDGKLHVATISCDFDGLVSSTIIDLQYDLKQDSRLHCHLIWIDNNTIITAMCPTFVSAEKGDTSKANTNPDEKDYVIEDIIRVIKCTEINSTDTESYERIDLSNEILSQIKPCRIGSYCENRSTGLLSPKGKYLVAAKAQVISVIVLRGPLRGSRYTLDIAPYDSVGGSSGIKSIAFSPTDGGQLLCSMRGNVVTYTLGDTVNDCVMLRKASDQSEFNNGRIVDNWTNFTVCTAVNVDNLLFIGDTGGPIWVLKNEGVTGTKMLDIALLDGHTNIMTTLAMDNTLKYMVTTAKQELYLWDFETILKQVKSRYSSNSQENDFVAKLRAVTEKAYVPTLLASRLDIIRWNPTEDYFLVLCTYSGQFALYDGTSGAQTGNCGYFSPESNVPLYRFYKDIPKKTCLMTSDEKDTIVKVKQESPLCLEMFRLSDSSDDSMPYCTLNLPECTIEGNGSYANGEYGDGRHVGIDMTPDLTLLAVAGNNTVYFYQLSWPNNNNDDNDPTITMTMSPTVKRLHHKWENTSEVSVVRFRPNY